MNLSTLQARIDDISDRTKSGQRFTYQDLQVLATVYLRGSDPNGLFASTIGSGSAAALRRYVTEGADIDLSSENPWKSNSIVGVAQGLMEQHILDEAASGAVGGALSTQDSDLRTPERTPPFAATRAYDFSRMDERGTLWANPAKMFFDNRFALTAAWARNGDTVQVAFQITDVYDFQSFSEQMERGKTHVTKIPIGLSTIIIPDGVSAALAEQGWAREYTRSATWSSVLSVPR